MLRIEWVWRRWALSSALGRQWRIVKGPVRKVCSGISAGELYSKFAPRREEIAAGPPGLHWTLKLAVEGV